MLGGLNLTEPDPVKRAQLADTHRGMAHFAGTGPVGKTCGDCRFRGYRRVSCGGMAVEDSVLWYHYYGCAKFFMLTFKHGPRIWSVLKACKYFEPKPERKSKVTALTSSAA